MNKALAILEVSQKQAYIFSSDRLRDNVARSNEIAYVTGDTTLGDFFSLAAPDAYDEKKNLIYAGGGHTVFQFDDAEAARRFVRRVTLRAMKEFPDMELFARVLDCRDYPEAAPSALLKHLSEELEKKKSVRSAAFRRMSFGVEKLDGVNWQPERIDGGERTRFKPADTRDFTELAGDKGFLAVVHIDGNGMGRRVQEIYDKKGGDWDSCCRSLRAFSEGIDRDFKAAYAEMEAELKAQFPAELDSKGRLPLRRVIMAGDDVCFVSRGSIGPEAARVFLEKLAKKENPEQPGQPYAACAGVALVHTKYPFHMAYDLAEELCSSAKRFGALIDEGGAVSAIDWHIEFGQLKDGLAEQRLDYITEDSTPARERHMELRPLAVVVPPALRQKAERVTGGLRTWDYFSRLTRTLKSSGRIARSKLKGLRNAVRQGEVETRYYLGSTRTREALTQLVERSAGFTPQGGALFAPIGGVERSLVFDSVELMDHIQLIGEAEK